MNRFLWHIKRGFRPAFQKESPFARPAVLVLGLGLGFVVVFANLFDQSFLRTIPGIPDQGSLAALEAHHGGGQVMVSFPLYQELNRRLPFFDGLAGWAGDTAILSVGAASEPPRMVGCQNVTANYFSVLGVRLARGRAFEAGRGQVGRQGHAAVISHRLWRGALGGRADAVGSAIGVNSQPVTVIGIASPGFRGPSMFGEIDLWMPMTLHCGHASSHVEGHFSNPRNGMFFNLVGRLATDSLQEARQQLSAFASTLDPQDWWPGGSNEPPRLLLLPDIARDSFTRKELEETFRTLALAVALILLVSTLNAAALLLSQSVARRREWAIAQALGCGRGRLFAQILRESLAIGLLAGAVGALLALSSRLWMPELRLIAYLPETSPHDLNWRAFGFTFLASALIGMAAGLIPAWMSARSDPLEGLRERADALGRFARLRRILVVGQAAVSFLLLAAALLFMKSLSGLYALDLGLTTERVVNARMRPAQLDIPQEDQKRLLVRLRGRLAADRRLETFSFAHRVPFGGSIVDRIIPEDGDGEATPLTIRTNSVSPGFFDTFGIPLLLGRGFGNLDALDRPQDALSVAIISKSLAERLWPHADPVGRRLRLFNGHRVVEVAGVVADHRTASVLQAHPLVYEPLGQRPLPGRIWISLKTEMSAEEAGALLRKEVQSLAPGLPVSDVETMKGRLDRRFSRQRTMAGGFPILALAALALASLGVWGLAAGAIRLRRRQIGIRLALGARHWDIQRAELGRAGVLAALGVAIGLAGLAALSDLLSPHLHQVAPLDPSALLPAAGILCLFALLASYIPLRAAARIDPAESLRCE
ncbi:MAG: ABC transporter permease [Acidobacteriota bacterium]